jgi:uncharacterized repeat protein (TIGR01451 family)
MSAFSFFAHNGPRKAPGGTRRKNTPLHLETLEDRSLPSGITISGYVYNDANNNGLFEPGETPIANNPIELHNAQNQVVASAITDSTGYYQFNSDNTINQTPLSITKTITFGPTPTDFSLQGMLDQFNPALGSLQEIDITHGGSITSDIKVENTSTSSGSMINGTVAGNLTLTAPGGVNDKLSISQYAGTFNAPVGDGTISFQGAAASDFGEKTANGSDNIVLTGNQLTPYIGTGQVQVTENAQATSNAAGGGNVAVNVVSTGKSTITVVYKYVPNNSIQPGNYTIVEKQEPPGFFPGKNSSNGTVLNTPPGVEVIPVTITTGDAPNNDFGKLRASSLAGSVYYDANDNGSLDGGDQGLSGVSVRLTGSTAGGAAVNLSTTTDANGDYKFDTLQQGTYSVTETPPSGYLDGAITLGSVGGVVGTHAITSIQLAANTDATNYNFGELKGGSLAGFVYLDANDNGVMDTGDTGIGNVTLTLTGTDDHNNPVTATTKSDTTGAYAFNTLRPGNYTITETPPPNYIDATDNLGTLGGTVGQDVISAIQLGMGQAGTQYNFGHKLPPTSDLGIVKTASAPVSGFGDQLTYTLAVTNYGPITAQNVVVTDTLPASETYISGTGNGWTVTQTGTSVTATMPSLAVGATSDITIVVKVPSFKTTLTNDSKVTSDTPDNNPNNNESKITTIVQGPPGTPVPQGGPPLIIGLPFVSKLQLIAGGLNYLDPTIRGQAAFVAGIFGTLQQQSASTATATGITLALINGTMAPQTFVSNMWYTPEHFTLEAQQLYQKYLGRGPTATEEAAFVQALQGGATLQSQTAAILTSTAYQALHSSSDQLAAALYQDITGSTPDATTQQSLVQSMGTQTLGDLVTSLQSSTAAINRAINQTFLNTLRRDATAGELALYGQKVQAGTLTTDKLAQQLLASQEFYQLAYNATK